MEIKVSTLVTSLLFVALFILGMPLDGQLGQFSAGSMYVDGVQLDQSDAKITKIFTMLVWLCLYLIAFFVLFFGKQNITITLRAIPFYLVFVAYLAITTLWSSEAVLGLFDLAQLTGSAAIGVVVAIYYRSRPYDLIKHVALALGAAQLLSTMLVLVVPSLGVAPNERWVGMYGSPNYLGSLAFCSLWANVSVIGFIKPRRASAYKLFALASLLNLWGTNSITSMGAAVIALGFMYWWPYLFGRGRAPVVNRIVLMSLCLIVFPGYLLGFMDPLIEGLFSISGRTSNLSGRAYIWEEAFFAIAENPILGHGFGSALKLQSIVRLTDLHSYYITTLFSGGLVGLALFALSLYQMFNSIIKSNYTVSNVPRIFVPIVLAILTYSLTETALFDPRSPTYIFFIIIIVLVRIVMTTSEKVK